MPVPEPVSNYNDAGLGPPTFNVVPSLEAVVVDTPPHPREKWPYDDSEEVPVYSLKPHGKHAWTVVVEGAEAGSYWHVPLGDIERWVYGDDKLLDEVREHFRHAQSLVEGSNRETQDVNADVSEALRKLDEALREKKPDYARS